MKSMTDFIMEQEVSTAPVEVFNESALVSNFMSMHAAAAEVTCILEFASIAEFCTENDINMPEQLVQEGFKDTINKIWTAIAKWFEKVADWFKSLVKGTISACSTSNLKQILAKLKTYPEDTEVKNEAIITNLIMIPVISKYIDKFREVALHPMSEHQAFNDNENIEKVVNDFMENIDAYITNLEFINKRSNWQDANGNLRMSNDELFTNLSCLNDEDKNDVTFLFDVLEPDPSDPNKKVRTGKLNKTYKVLEGIITSLISFDVPKTGAKILEELDADINNFRKVTNQTKDITIDVKQGNSAAQLVQKTKKDHNIDVDPNAIVTAMKSAGLITKSNPGVGDQANGNGTITVQYQVKVWIADKDVKTKVTKASNLLATGYDLIKVTLTESISKEFKDIKAADEKSYKKELKSAEKSENSVSIKNM